MYPGTLENGKAENQIEAEVYKGRILSESISL
jgi:hypothetical protein